MDPTKRRARPGIGRVVAVCTLVLAFSLVVVPSARAGEDLGGMVETPAIRLDLRYGQVYAESGEATASVGVLVGNRGSEALANVALIGAECDGPQPVVGDEVDPAALRVGEQWEYTCEIQPAKLMARPDGTFQTELTVTATSTGGRVSDTATLPLSPFIGEPVIWASSEQPKGVYKAGDTVTFATRVLARAGKYPLRLAGSACDAEPQLVDGDDNHDGLIEADEDEAAINEVWFYTCQHVITADEARLSKLTNLWTAKSEEEFAVGHSTAYLDHPVATPPTTSGQPTAHGAESSVTPSVADGEWGYSVVGGALLVAGSAVAVSMVRSNRRRNR